MERMPQAKDPDSTMVTMLVDFVVDCVRLWHTSNPGHEDQELAESVQAWESFICFVGVDSWASIRLERNEEGALQRDEDGAPLAVWAQSCKDLPRILQQIFNLRASGSLFDDGVQYPIRRNSGWPATRGF